MVDTAGNNRLVVATRPELPVCGRKEDILRIIKPIDNGRGISCLPLIRRATIQLYALEDFLGLSLNEDDAETRTCSFPPDAQLRGNDVIQWRSLLSSSGAEITVPRKQWIVGNERKQPCPSELQEEATVIVSDVLHLLGRLETDRVNTNVVLDDQKRKNDQLRQHIDKYAIMRMQHLPVAVQTEHERNATNFQELQWHIAFAKRRKDCLEKNVLQLRKIHDKMSREIKDITSNRPLIESKIELEKEKRKIIQGKQDATDSELDDACSVLRQIEAVYDIAVKQSDENHSVLAAEVGAVRDELEVAIDELANCKSLFESHILLLDDLNVKLTENEKESTALDKSIKTYSSIHEELDRKCTEFNERIEEQTEEHANLLKDNAKLKEEKKTYQNMLESQNAKLQQKIKKQQASLKATINSNREIERDIRLVNKDIEKCGKQQLSDEKAMKRAANQSEKIAQELEICMEETGKVHLLHGTLKVQLQEERENASTVEEELQKTSEELQNEVKEESQARIILQARIAADTIEYEDIVKESTKKQKKIDSQRGETQQALDGILEQVNILEKAHSDRQQLIGTLKIVLDKLETQVSHLESEMNEEITKLQEQLNSHTSELMTVTKTLDDMKWQSDTMNDKMTTMVASSCVMNRNINSNQDTIEEQNKDTSELRIQLLDDKKQIERLKAAVQGIEARRQSMETFHFELLSSRQMAYNQAKGRLESSLVQNDQLSSHYLQLQTELIANKDKLLKRIELSNISKENAKDQKSLCDMHKRLHEALEAYYRLRGLQLRSGISKFERETLQNGDKLSSVTTQLQHLVDSISNFLIASQEG